MSLEVTLDTSGLDRIMREMPGKVEAFLDWKAEDMVTEIKLSFGTSPPGIAYRRGGVTHIASVEGYPPNIDIGDLEGSIDWEQTGKFERTISDGVEYGLPLEEGTDHIAARPFMRPAFDRAQQAIEPDARARLKLE